MDAIEYIPHTADIRLKVTAVSNKALYETALSGMSNLMRKNYCEKKRKLPLDIKIQLEASDLTTLLIDFLSEVLTISYLHQAIFCRVYFKHLSDHILDAHLFGAHVRKFDEDIKAVTHHETNITYSSTGEFETMIVYSI